MSEQTVVIVEDHPVLRKGLEALLRTADIHVIGGADTADEGYRLVLARRPDVTVIDIGLQEGSGVELTERLLKDDPDAAIVVYTGLSDRRVIEAAAKSGARGFALKARNPSDLIDAIRVVAAGGMWIDPTVARILAPSLTPGGVLSPREREVLDLLADGLTGEDVAERLVLSPETVRTHIRNAMRKLDANTRAHAVALAVRQREIGD